MHSCRNSRADGATAICIPAGMRDISLREAIYLTVRYVPSAREKECISYRARTKGSVYRICEANISHRRALSRQRRDSDMHSCRNARYIPAGSDIPTVRYVPSAREKECISYRARTMRSAYRICEANISRCEATYRGKRLAAPDGVISQSVTTGI